MPKLPISMQRNKGALICVLLVTLLPALPALAGAQAQRIEITLKY